jgi:antibiotic biosynthesis monooxygenase (ABM) superfamily enzyme
MGDRIESASSVSLVIEHDLPIGKESEFSRWQSEIIAASSQFEGYLRTEILPPMEEDQDKWYTVIYFDTAEHLTRWLESDVRHKLIKTKRKNLGSYQFIHYETGLESWFARQKNSQKIQLSPPPWKQAFAVLFGLYPTVMLETLLFSYLGLMESWSLAPTVLVNNLISCFLLTWLVMPFVRKLLHFWLQPRSDSWHTDFSGTLIIFLGLGFMVSIFNAFF